MIAPLKCFAVLFPCVCLLGACSTAIQPIASDEAVVGYRSQVYDDLVDLPPPKEPIVITVYKFRDQTGQYKPSENLVQYSTAVTQGTTSMLIKALRDAGRGRWFTVLEREGLQNLLNERKIIRQTRQQYAAMGSTKTAGLSPLLFSPILIEGGIIAYESNLLTGGMGAKYFGAGGSTEFRRDTVTIYLRAVSVKNGKVLENVNTSKTILSTRLDLGLFRFVGFKRLLEAEIGVSTNEPPQMAVLEAIEKAIYALIMEGVNDKVWSFADPIAGRRPFRKYMEEKEGAFPAEFDDQGISENGPPPEYLIMQN